MIVHLLCKISVLLYCILLVLHYCTWLVFVLISFFFSSATCFQMSLLISFLDPARGFLASGLPGCFPRVRVSISGFSIASLSLSSWSFTVSLGFSFCSLHVSPCVPSCSSVFAFPLVDVRPAICGGWGVVSIPGELPLELVGSAGCSGKLGPFSTQIRTWAVKIANAF